MIIELPYLNHLFAPKVGAFNCSFRAVYLMIHQLVQALLDLTTKQLKLAGMGNFLDHPVAGVYILPGLRKVKARN